MPVLVFSLIFSTCFLVEANIGTCSYTKVVQKQRQRSYSSPYIYTYHKSCRIFFTCTEFETRYSTHYYTETYTETETYYKCCPGYEPDNSFSSISCKPICNPPCRNSNCTAPDFCTCHLGYVKSSNSTVCIPKCLVPCIGGSCVKPDVCECKPGYVPYLNHPHICKPYCESECINGDCIAPNICKCKPDYALSQTNQNRCVPICIPECINGECVSPGICRCFKGFLQVDHSHICTPHCSRECTNGKCIAFETCKCNSGFTTSKTNKYICVPKCSPSCIHGVCESPNKCTCIPGYKMIQNSSTVCEPICDINCPEFGYCALPYHCACQSGYEFNETKYCVPTCLPNCINGECSAPDNCTCLAGFQATDDWNRCELICEDHCIHGRCEDNKCLYEEERNGTDCSTMDSEAITKVPSRSIHQKKVLSYWYLINIAVWLLIFSIFIGFCFIYKKRICLKPKKKLQIPDNQVVHNSIYMDKI